MSEQNNCSISECTWSWWPSWISEQNNCSISECPCCQDSCHGGHLGCQNRTIVAFLNAHDHGGHLGYQNRTIVAFLNVHVVKIAAMVAILDVRTEQLCKGMVDLSCFFLDKVSR